MLGCDGAAACVVEPVLNTSGSTVPASAGIGVAFMTGAGPVAGA